MASEISARRLSSSLPREGENYHGHLIARLKRIIGTSKCSRRRQLLVTEQCRLHRKQHRFPWHHLERGISLDAEENSSSTSTAAVSTIQGSFAKPHAEVEAEGSEGRQEKIRAPRELEAARRNTLPVSFPTIDHTATKPSIGRDHKQELRCGRKEGRNQEGKGPKLSKRKAGRSFQSHSSAKAVKTPRRRPEELRLMQQ